MAGDRADSLPDDLWLRVLARLDYQPLCCVAQASRRLGRLANEDSLWRGLCDGRGFGRPAERWTRAAPSSHRLMKAYFESRSLRERRRRAVAAERDAALAAGALAAALHTRARLVASIADDRLARDRLRADLLTAGPPPPRFLANELRLTEALLRGQLARLLALRRSVPELCAVLAAATGALPPSRRPQLPGPLLAAMRAAEPVADAR